MLVGAMVVAGGTAHAQGGARSPEAPALVWADAPLADALYAFSEASGVEIVFALRLVRDVRVTGRYGPGEPAGPALAALLRGTGLRAERLRQRQYVLIEEPLNVPVVGEDPAFFTGTLEGRVVDAETGEAVIGAHVWLVDLDLGDVVDLDGGFAVERLPTGTYTVRVSHVGYRPVRVELSVFPASPQLPPTVRLRAEAVQSEAATVRPRALPPEPEPGLAVLTPEASGPRTALALAGPLLSGDLAGGLSLVPGVAREASDGLVVRGAADGRALAVRDGVPVYGAGALAPSFNPEGLAQARLHSGPLPVELDGGAGVLELETRPVPTAPRGVIGAGLGGLTGFAAAPLAPTLAVQAGWGRPAPADWPLASAREAGGALVVDPRGGGGPVVASRGAWDAEAKLMWVPRPAQTVELGAYRGTGRLVAARDEAPGEGRGWRLRSASEALGLRARGLLGDKTFATAVAYGTRARAEEAAPAYGVTARLDEAGLRLEADHALSTSHQVRVGVHAAARRQTAEASGVGVARGQQSAREVAVYARDTWKPGPRTELRPGLRLVFVGGRARVQPRLQGRWSAVPERLDLRAGLARQAQGVHRLRGLDAGGRDLAATRWLLASAGSAPGAIAPETGWSAGLGAEWRPAPGFALGADVYARAARGVRLPTGAATGEPPAGVAALAEAFPAHRERAAGVELGAALRRGGWAVQAAAALARADVQAEAPSGSAGGLWRASPYGRPVTLSLAAERTLGPGVLGALGTVGARLDAASGRPASGGAGRSARGPALVRLTLGADVETEALGATWTLGARAEALLSGGAPLADGPLAPGAPLALGPLGRSVVPGLRLTARW